MMKRHSVLLAVFAAFCIGVASGCRVQPPPAPPTLEELPGTYVLKWQGVTDAITLLPGGRFQQAVRYKDGKTYRFSGKWSRGSGQYQLYLDENVWFALGNEGVNPISKRAGGSVPYEVWKGDDGMKLMKMQGGSEDYFFWVKQK
jgi:hypothetical protein